MPRSLSIAFVAVAMLIGAAPWNAARAMPLGAVRADTAITRVAVVCGLSGCAPVLTKRVHKPPANFVTRAAPLVFPTPNAPPTPVAANNK